MLINTGIEVVIGANYTGSTREPDIHDVWALFMLNTIVKYDRKVKLAPFTGHLYCCPAWDSHIVILYQHASGPKFSY